MITIINASASKEILSNRRGLNFDKTTIETRQKIKELFGDDLTPTQVVELILNQVHEFGDIAVRELCRKLDGTNLTEIEVSSPTIEKSIQLVSSNIIEALSIAAKRIEAFHKETITRNWMDFNHGYGQIINPLHRIGIYIPGGTATYPSTVLMTAIPARVAGVKEIILCTPSKGEELPNPTVLAAANIAGVDKIFKIGGAQAIAAMTYGTETVPKVDMICGPGNLFVAIAKKLLFGEVGIDGIYGPTETVVIADETANPTLCAADLIAQAEHDVLAIPILITTSKILAESVAKEIETRVSRIERGNIASKSIEDQGFIIISENIDNAIALANEFAPEHLSLMIKDPWDYVENIHNAGAIFVGEFSYEVLGDYVAGPSHVMPTGGTARFSSGLGVHSFVKISPVTALDKATSNNLAKIASIIAREEGLTGHAEAAEIRQELLPEDV